jgi:hypothetical protein
VGWRSAAPAAWASPLAMAGGGNDDPRGLGIDAVALELRWHRQSKSANRYSRHPSPNRSSRHASPDWHSRHTGRKLLGHSFGSERYHCTGASASYRSTYRELIRLVM